MANATLVSLLGQLGSSSGAGVAASLTERAGDDGAAGILAGHLAALLHYREGDIEKGQSLLVQAAEREAAVGCRAGSLHSLHQSRLLTHLAGNARRAAEYYTETFRTLRSLRNPEGSGLCLRSLGELSLAAGKVAETATFWNRSVSLLGSAQAPEADLVASWLESLAGLDATS